MNAYSLSVKRRYISNPSLTNNQARHKFFSSYFSGKNQKGDRIPDYSELNRMTCTGRSNLIYRGILDGNSDLLAKRRRNRVIIPLDSNQEGENQLIPSSGILIEIPQNGILHRNSILAYFDDPRYIRKSSGLTKYETRELNSIVNEEDLIEYRGVKIFQILKYYLLDENAKPYLATPGATVHGHYGEILYDGDTLVTFIYEKSRSGDITQGLPKVEQVLEVRSIDSISMNLEKRIQGWNKCITRILGIPWAFFIGAELTVVQSHISLVNKVQKVYRAQGVQIHKRHIEIIVRQITSKVLVSEDEMSNVFSPEELIGLLRTERMGRALEEAICYQAILLGITRASMNTQSFISEASFQKPLEF
ncbi:hypothetical protein R6Q59_034933 [Mikania micrantha]